MPKIKEKHIGAVKGGTGAVRGALKPEHIKAHAGAVVKRDDRFAVRGEPGTVILGMPQYPGVKVMYLPNTIDINWKHVEEIKTLTNFDDNTLADWLNISVKTFREYKKPNSTLKANIKEQVFLLLLLIDHGKKVFGSVEDFNNWLNQENFYFDSRKPTSFLNTITGINFIEDRLTAMEYGDNV